MSYLCIESEDLSSDIELLNDDYSEKTENMRKMAESSKIEGTLPFVYPTEAQAG